MFEYFNGYNNVSVDNVEKLEDLSQDEINNLACGPQDLFFERLETLNSEMELLNISPISVTNKWNWRPGSYDRVKEYLYKKIELNRKCMSVNKLISRTMDRVNYLGYINRQADIMERERANLKQLGVSKDVDIVKFKENCETFVADICNQCENVLEVTDSKVSIVPYIKIDGRKTSLFYDVTLNDLTLSIFDGKENIKCIQEIPLNTIHIIIVQSLRHVLNNQSRSISLLGRYKGTGPRLEYVYITKPYRDTPAYGTVCLDKHHDDIIKAVKNNDLLSLSIQLVSWAQYYNIKCANPYNQPYQSHIGMPETFSKEYKAVADTKSVTNNCRHILHKHSTELGESHFETDKYMMETCNGINCQLKDFCDANIQIMRRQSNMNSDFGYRVEGLVGWIVETLIEEYIVKEIALGKISDAYSYLMGDSLSLWDYKDSHTGEFDISKKDELIAYMTVHLFWYYMNFAKQELCGYTYDFLVRYKLIDREIIKAKDVKDTKSMNTDELEIIMKQWAETQRGG